VRAAAWKTHFAKAEGLDILSRSISHLPTLPKFKDERTMPFTKGQPDDRSDLRDLVYGWGKVVTRRAFGEAGPGLDLDFDSIESLAVDMAQTLTRGTVEEILRRQFQLLGDEQPCPQCSRPCPVKTAPRTVAVRGGTIDYEEPICHCPACRRDFFPSAAQPPARRARLLSGDLG
jgi:hypothetical protein